MIYWVLFLFFFGSREVTCLFLLTKNRMVTRPTTKKVTVMGRMMIR